MKRKILAASLLAFCCLGLTAGESSAFFGLFDCSNPYSIWNCRHRYVTQITCRPYNAFTPICWGNLVCDGCCPNPCACASGCLPMTMGAPPFPCNGCCPMPGGCGMSYGGGCGPEGCCASDMGPMMAQQMPMQNQYPQQQPPVNNRPPAWQPPNPNPMPMPVGPMGPMGPMGPNTTMMYPQNFGVAQAAYQQPYYPMPYPNYYQPTYNPYSWQPQMPSYWYGGR